MVNNLSGYVNFKGVTQTKQAGSKQNVNSAPETRTETPVGAYSAENVRAYNTTGISNSLSTPEVQQKYAEVSSMLDPEARVELSKLLKSGVLLNNNSNDGSSVLDNLHKMATEPRIKGLDTKNLLTQTIQTIANPEVISQNFGDLPDAVARSVFRHSAELGVKSADEINVDRNGSNTCVAASLEYDMASTAPAEFARFAAALSSDDYTVTKEMPLEQIAGNKEDSLWVLQNFNIPYEETENGTVKINISPDRNAIIRARVQTSYQDEGERSALDVLMQSAFMNVGSQNTYNSLNDTREVGAFYDAGDRSGLGSLEVALTSNMVGDKPKDTVFSQIVDNEGKLQPVLGGYNAETVAAIISEKLPEVLPQNLNEIEPETFMEVMPDMVMSVATEALETVLSAKSTPELQQQMAEILHKEIISSLCNKPTNDLGSFCSANMPEIAQETVRKTTLVIVQDIMKSSILASLQQGNNVMVGYIGIDEEAGTYTGGGHEINIIDSEEAPTGETVFICKDTQESEPVYILESQLLPRLYHTSLPQDLIDYNTMGTMQDSLHSFISQMRSQEAEA